VHTASLALSVSHAVLVFRLNTFGAKILVSGKTQDNNAVYHYPHEYTDTLKNIYMTDFLGSDHHEKLLRSRNGRPVSLSTFKEGASKCPCIMEPKYRFCVDETETGFTELLKALQTRRKVAKEDNPCDCNFCRSEATKKKVNPLGAVTMLSIMNIRFLFLLYFMFCCVSRIYSPNVKCGGNVGSSLVREGALSCHG
jgi:hypothetical protein